MLRGAIVGFGNVAEFGHWPGYAANDEIEIVAIVDSSPERRAAAARLQPSLGGYASLEEINSDAIDFVDVCTPPALHGGPIRQAIARGWHVIGEKPFVLDRLLLDLIGGQALRKNLAVVPIHNWKYAPIIRAATQLLRGGEIGELREIAITTWRTKAATTAHSTKGNWRVDPTIAGGGILMDHGWHAIYLALDWFGESPTPRKVELHCSGDAQLEDEAIVSLQFPSGRARIELSWKAARRTNVIELKGSRGKILIDDDKLELNGRTRQFDSGLSAGSHHPDWFAAMLPDVIAAIRNPTLSRPGLKEAALCLTMIQSCYSQARDQVSARR